ncbi:NAD(P)-binding protein [Klenkia terrae]|uniref:NAD(P)-binding protein n=1 Tax=Klenkia terrae TaxID=1052259 RepID=UPI003607EC4C
MSSDPTPVPVAVLGSGMAAMGAAHALRDAGREAVCFDAKSYAGGHTATFDAGHGFLFDDGPHLSFTSDERVAGVFADAVDGRFRTVQAHIDNVWRGHRVRHPVQLNLHGLPPSSSSTSWPTSSRSPPARSGPSSTTRTGWSPPTAARSPRPSRWSTAASTTRPSPRT